MAIVYGEMGNHMLLKEYWRQANRIREEFFRYNSKTINNYCRLKQILDRKKVKWVCVQYPVRNIEPLKKIFEGQGRTIFVDNEEIFKSAIIREGYRDYFVDMFSGEFGHCTRKGNRLLAGNIANAIFKEYFSK